MEGVFNYIIQNIDRLYVTRENLLLLYVRGEGELGKSRIIHALEIGFTLLKRRNELVISVPTGCVAEGIRRSTMHATLSINIYKTRRSYINISKILTDWFLLIIDKLSKINLRLFAIINIQLCKVWYIIVSSTFLFCSLFLMIFICNFYQSIPRSNYALWDLPYNKKEILRKVLWDNF